MFHCSDLQRRCPQGKKTVLYKQAKSELFAEYLMQDGMVSRLTEFADSARGYFVLPIAAFIFGRLYIKQQRNLVEMELQY